jgi:pyrroline-5-carboxylate reductase
MSVESQRIGFLGAGAMASALAGGLAASGVPRAQLCASEPDAVRRAEFARLLGETTADNASVVLRSDVVVFAVKPGVVSQVQAELASLPERERLRVLWISIAAGVPLARLESGLPRGARVIRAMPNTPALVRRAATAFVANAAANAADRAVARALFASVGSVWEAPREELLDAVTAVSGSGPAYFFLLIESLIDAGVAVGLPPEAARELALQTALGSALLARESERSPGELREQVTSPGGTTQAGLARLAARDLRGAVAEAVRAAAERSRELGRSA